MPTYAYACKACDYRGEHYQSFDEDALTTCGDCGGQLRKLFSSVGVMFKGSGFYRTDSRGGGRTSSLAPAKTDTPAASAAKSEPAASASVPSSDGGSSASTGALAS